MKTYPPSLIEEIRTRYAAGETQPEIAASFGKSPMWVSKIMSRNGLVRRQAARRTRPVHERFWEKVDKTSGHGPNGDCWVWMRPTHRQYGRFTLDRSRRQVRAHRMAWELSFGAIPDGLVVCHHCDNPPCVNPAHLFVGTQLDNAVDRDAKQRWQPLVGEEHPEAKLRREAVCAMRYLRRAHGLTFVVLGRAYGIAPVTANRICKGTSWAHESYLLPIAQ